MATTKKTTAKKPAAKQAAPKPEENSVLVVEEPVIKQDQNEILVKDIPLIKIVDEYGNKFRMEPDFARGKYILRPRL